MLNAVLTDRSFSQTQARRHYAADFSEKDKVAVFHGKKDSNVRLRSHATVNIG